MDTFRRWQTLAVDQPSAAAAADLAFLEPEQGKGAEVTILQFGTSGPVSFDFENTGANAISVIIYTHNDRDDAIAKWKTEEPSFDIANGATATKDIVLPTRTYCRVQFVDKVAASHGALKARVVQKRV